MNLMFQLFKRSFVREKKYIYFFQSHLKEIKCIKSYCHSNSLEGKKSSRMLHPTICKSFVLCCLCCTPYRCKEKADQKRRELRLIFNFPFIIKLLCAQNLYYGQFWPPKIISLYISLILAWTLGKHVGQISLFSTIVFNRIDEQLLDVLSLLLVREEKSQYISNLWQKEKCLQTISFYIEQKYRQSFSISF